MKVILVGAGGTTRELLRRLGGMWQVTVVDTSVERLETLAALRPIELVVGDGSSRLVLGKAGLERADALVAATDNDDVNLEACRLALAQGIARVAAVAAQPESVGDYQRAGIAAIAPDGLAARRLELGLETRRISSTAFAGGRAEAIEFRISPDSLVCGHALAKFHAKRFIVGAVLRGQELLIPHGDTVLQAGDLVTVVGAGADFADIVRTFTSSEGRFPLDFGKRVAVALEREADLAASVTEATHLARNSRASSLVLAHLDPARVRDEVRQATLGAWVGRAIAAAEGVEVRPRPVSGRPSKAMVALVREESIGVLVVPVPPGPSFAALRAVRRVMALVERTGKPVLLSRSSHPYRRILVPARGTPSGRAAARAAIDLARFSGAELRGVGVIEPVFISGPAAPKEAEAAIEWLKEEAAVQGVDVSATIRRGNPVRTFVELGAESDLVVLATSGGAVRRYLRLEIAVMFAWRSARSVLFVPAREGD